MNVNDNDDDDNDDNDDDDDDNDDDDNDDDVGINDGSSKRLLLKSIESGLIQCSSFDMV